MEKAFFTSLYMLCLAVGYITFAKFVDVGNLGILPKIVTGTLGTILLAFGIYLAYCVTRQPTLKQS